MTRIHKALVGGGIAGPVTAKRQYRRRGKQLREIIEQADRNGDASASEAASKELEVLSRELSAAAGLHGRDRRLDDEVERARKTVSARIHDALSRIAFAHPARLAFQLCDRFGGALLVSAERADSVGGGPGVGA
jgi:hypothetical protein